MRAWRITGNPRPRTYESYDLRRALTTPNCGFFRDFMPFYPNMAYVILCSNIEQNI